MNYQDFFENKLADLRDEGNYRVFADLERHQGAFPKATNRIDDVVREVTICAVVHIRLCVQLGRVKHACVAAA